MMIKPACRLITSSSLYQKIPARLFRYQHVCFSGINWATLRPHFFNYRKFISSTLPKKEADESSEVNDHHMVEAFLESFGEEEWAESFSSWDHLLIAKSPEMKHMDIPTKSRKKILRNVEEWRAARRCADQEALIKEQETIKKLQDIISKDIGERGIESFVIDDDLLTAALDLTHSEHVVILTGFPVFPETGVEPVCETDGPMGALAIARALTLKPSNSVVICTDLLYEELFQQLIKDSGIPDSQISIKTFTPRCGETEFHEVVEAADHIVAIERPGPSTDGKYYSMHKKNISEYVASLDEMIAMAKSKGCRTTGIGDGGNEIGMGKVLDQVKKFVPFGDEIGCKTICDNLIVAGISNWGGYALAAAMGVLDSGTIKKDKFLATSEQEMLYLRQFVTAGARDGRTGEQVASTVDGVDWKFTASVLQELQIVLDKYKPFDIYEKMGKPKLTRRFLNQINARKLLAKKNQTSKSE